jgi:sarcosine oxidase subunit beta
MALSEIFFPKRMWRQRPDLKRRYEVVIVGGGSHGLATAYYLAKRHGITDVAILEKSYIGSGASGRNTTIIRSNYRTPEGAAFYGESVRLYEGLSDKLDFNLMFSQHGHLTLAHSDRAMITMQERAEVNQLLGIKSSVIYPPRIAELCPELDLSQRPAYPIVGRLYHPPGGIIRHDAVVWGFARAADRRGVEIHQGTEVTGFERDGDRITAVETNRGRVECGQVVSATAGWSSLVGRLVGLRLPITTHILQAFVTEPVKPFLDVVLVSSQLHVYVSQTDRGEFLIGAEIEPYTTYKSDGHALVPRVLGRPCDGAPAAARAHQGAPHVDRALRPLARLQPDPGQDRDRQLPRLDRGGGRTASRPRRSSASRSPSSSRAGRRPTSSLPSPWNASTPTPSSPSWPRPR